MKTLIDMLAIAVLITAVAVPTSFAVAHEEREEREEHGRGGHREGHGRGADREGREGDRERPTLRAPDPAARAAYAKECGACHLDFPPALLGPAAHERILASLDAHFGQNAELDADVVAQLRRFLVANAGADERGPTPAPRISTLPWFVKEHRKASSAVGAGRPVKSFAACASCHPAAKDWRFDEDGVRVPR
jgi:hypothetical protein